MTGLGRRRPTTRDVVRDVARRFATGFGRQPPENVAMPTGRPTSYAEPADHEPWVAEAAYDDAGIGPGRWRNRHVRANSPTRCTACPATPYRRAILATDGVGAAWGQADGVLEHRGSST